MFHVEQLRRWVEILRQGASDLGVALSEAQVSDFVTYLRELTAWNQKINLTAMTDDKEIAVKHFLDSLACARALPSPQGASLLDIGSGAGLPGLPLKILHPELHLTLLEPSLKKTAFLRHLIGTLHVKDTEVISKRLQDFTRDPNAHGRFSYVMTRALSLSEILPFVRPVLAHQGRLILCRTKPLEPQIKLRGLQKTQEIGYTLPYGYGKRVLSMLTVVDGA